MLSSGPRGKGTSKATHNKFRTGLDVWMLFLLLFVHCLLSAGDFGSLRIEDIKDWALPSVLRLDGVSGRRTF